MRLHRQYVERIIAASRDLEFGLSYPYVLPYVIRGAGPVIAPTPLFFRPGCSIFAQWVTFTERDAARLTRGRVMNPNPRPRNRPQRARGPQNSAGKARPQYARYLARAREAQLAGDVVEMENCYQHAVMKGAGDDQRA
jgi:hypothetical protein